jgi:hypothetical protein
MFWRSGPTIELSCAITCLPDFFLTMMPQNSAISEKYFRRPPDQISITTNGRAKPDALISGSEVANRIPFILRNFWPSSLRSGHSLQETVPTTTLNNFSLLTVEMDSQAIHHTAKPSTSSRNLYLLPADEAEGERCDPNLSIKGFFSTTTVDEGVRSSWHLLIGGKI